jgi:ABC-2 type transport system ATP-binding protein
MDYILEIHDLTKDYEIGFWKKRPVRALDGLTLSVEPGQIFGFLGGNGAGKTTTLKILMGLLFPTAGSAKILGCDISDVNMRRRIGYCPESPYFYDYLTAAELMDYFGQIFGYPADVRRTKSRDLLTRVGLSEKDWNKQLRKFSKGMQQRVGLAQALINEPEIVFLDEPMSGLDPVGRREVRELISSLRDEGTTVFMSTHILSDVEALCDNVAILRNGKLAEKGRLSDLLMENAGRRTFEVLVSGVAPAAVERDAANIEGCRVFSKPGGICIEVPDEAAVDAALAAVRQLGGNLISVNPVKQSLEELFVDKLPK